jgi:biotin-(acetyl-CoA carboxylase) ligase
LRWAKMKYKKNVPKKQMVGAARLGKGRGRGGRRWVAVEGQRGQGGSR